MAFVGEFRVAMMPGKLGPVVVGREFKGELGTNDSHW